MPVMLCMCVPLCINDMFKCACMYIMYVYAHVMCACMLCMYARCVCVDVMQGCVYVCI